MHTKKHRGKTQRGCGMCGKKRCKKHRRQTMKGGCGTCVGGGQKGGNNGSSVGLIDNATTLGFTVSNSFMNFFRGMAGVPAVSHF